MKKLFHVLTLTLALNFLAVVGVAGWLWQGGRLNRANARAIKEVMFPAAVPPTPAGAPAKAAATQPFINLDELLAKHSGQRAGEQVEVIQQSFDVQSAQLDRRRRELDALAEQVAREQKKLADAGAALVGSQRQLEQREQENASRANDKGFQDSLKLYSSMQPAQVKKVFMTLSEETVMNYLQAMPARSATKIVKEFKTKEETDLIHQVLEKMRQAGTPGQSGPGTTATDAKGRDEPKEDKGIIGPSANGGNTPTDSNPGR